MAQQFTRQELFETLRLGAKQVSFTKVDGSTRIMNCSLYAGDLPEKFEDKSGKTKEANQSVLPVFDIDVKEWRCFRVANVTSVEDINAE